MHPDSLRPFVLAFLCHGLLLSVWAEPLKTRLTQSPHQLVYEAYIDDNWEIMTSHADGSHVRNLTRSKDRHELYPQVSPDGTKLCFVSDQGAGRDTVRSVHIMNMDGSGPVSYTHLTLPTKA